MEPKEPTIKSMAAARWFGMSRPNFYLFAAKHGIRLLTEKNAARTRQERLYSRDDAERVYRALYNAEPPTE